MATLFPTAVDTLTNPTANDYQSSLTVPHYLQHANANDAIEAIQTAIFGIRMDLAVSRIVPGATSLSLRNNANTFDNLILTDAGIMSLRNDIILSLAADSRQTWVNQTDQPFRVNKFGVGIGKTPVYGEGLAITMRYTDPTIDCKGFDVAMQVYLTSGNNAFLPQASNPSTYLTDNGYNLTGSLYATVTECHVTGTSSGAHGEVIGISTTSQLDATTSASATTMYGVQAATSVRGTGTATTAIGMSAAVNVLASGGAVDGNITNGYVYQARLVNQTGAATPGVMALGRGYYVVTPSYSATGKITDVVGVSVGAQYNTLAASSTAGGFTSKGVEINLGNQGGNTSGTDINYGLYLVGNGGTAGGGGTVTNYAIYSTSTAQSLLTGNLALNAANMVIGSSTLDAARSLYLHGSGTTGTSQYAVDLAWTLSSAATANGFMLHSVFRTAAAAYTMTTGYNLMADTPIIGAASAVTTLYGAYIANHGNAGVTTSYGLRIADQSGSATNWAFNSGAGKHLIGSAAATLGFYGATDIVQAVLATGTGKTVDNVITALQNLGLVKQS